MWSGRISAVESSRRQVLDYLLYSAVLLVASGTKHHSEGGIGSGKVYTPDYDDDSPWQMEGCETSLCPLIDTAFSVIVFILVLCFCRCFGA